MNTLNLFDKQLDTARQNVELTKSSLAEVMMAAQRNPNDAALADQVTQLERELANWETKVKSAEIATTYAKEDHDSAAAVAAREAAQDAARNAHDLLIKEHADYTASQIKMYKALAEMGNGNSQEVEARLSKLCVTLARSATKGMRHNVERASEKFSHIRYFLMAEGVPQIENLDKAIKDAEHNHQRVKEWAGRCLAESLAAISAKPAK